MRLFILSFIIIATLVVQGCTSKAGNKPDTDKATKKTQPVALKQATVVADQPPFSITLPGELKPYEQVNIYPKIKGFVKKIYVDRGSMVRKGQLLAVLEAPEIGQQFAARHSATGSAYQKFLFSKQTYQRLKEAAKKNGAVATIELEKAYAQYIGDSAAYSSSRSEASATGQIQNYLRITAPFSGVITGRYISEGALVGDNGMNGQPLFELSQQNKLRLTVAIPEKQAQSLPSGTKANFTVVDFPGKTFTATLARHSGALEKSSRSVIAEFDIENTNTELRAGQYARVAIQLKRPQTTLWVPESSVVHAQSGVFVIKNDNSTARRIPVQTGISQDSLVEIFGNLKAGDKIVAKGSEEIKEGTIIGN